MSYLLKALQKAEQERQQNIHPDQPETVVVAQKATLPKGLVLLAIVLLVLTIWQILKADTSTPNIEELEQDEADIVLETQVVTQRNQAPAVLKKNESPNVTKSVIKPVQVEVIEPKAKDLSELSAAELAMIPSLDLASHIYSSASDYRSVVINGQTYKEGMLISAGLKLEEINSNGIIVNIQGQKVELPKGISWVASQNAK